MWEQRSARTVECGIGVREIVGGDGSTRRRLLVHCEHRGESVEVMACEACERRVALRLPTARARGAVECLADEVPAGDDPGLRVPVRAVMNRDAGCLRPDVSLVDARALLLRWPDHCAPAVDDDGHPVGVVSLADVARGRRAGACTVREVMTPLVFTVFEGTELSRAAAVMSSTGLRQLPVVRGDGSVAGLLSTSDVAHWSAGGP
jgi:CBS domain-containing protein